MCITAACTHRQLLPRGYRLILANNRDEFFGRPAQKVRQLFLREDGTLVNEQSSATSVDMQDQNGREDGPLRGQASSREQTTPVFASIDAQGGGTWLAFNPQDFRVSTVLNFRQWPLIPPASKSKPQSRGVRASFPFSLFIPHWAEEGHLHTLLGCGMSETTMELSSYTSQLTDSCTAAAMQVCQPTF